MPGAVLMMGMGEGGGAVVDTQTLTCGTSGTLNGYDQSLGLGSLSDGSSNIYGGASIVRLAEVIASSTVSLVISGNNANSGWETMNISGTGSFARSSASYSFNGVNTFWSWTATLPASGSYTVTFTL